MKLVLTGEVVVVKNSYGIYAPNHDNGEIELKDVSDAHNYHIDVSFKEHEWIPVKDNKFTVPQLKGEVVVKVRLKHLVTGNMRMFTSDPIPCTQYFCLGKPVQELYPKILEDLYHKNYELTDMHIKLAERVRKLEEEGDLL